MVPQAITRRKFVSSAALAAVTASGLAQSSEQRDIQFSQIHGPSEQDELTPGPFLAADERIGFAIVGLGRLAVDQILPAFSQSKYARPVALVSGSADKAIAIAAQYGIKSTNIYNYGTFDELRHNPAVQAIYIVLPNGLHEQYVIRGAALGKHILCEKPMANSVAEAERMIASCKQARVKLMIAYRQQYEPHNTALRQLIQHGRLGQLRSFVTSNSQEQGDPTQWRLNKVLAGGGCLPDVGLYCLNASRFLSGQEPVSVSASLYQPKTDPRFKQVEAGCNFLLTFPNGFVATCSTSYDVHKSQFFRMEGTDAWAELSPAYAYHGNRLSLSKLEDGLETLFTPQVEEKNQFALEMDHFCGCIKQDKTPQTPGEEGLRDQRIMAAIYEAARTAKTVAL